MSTTVMIIDDDPVMAKILTSMIREMKEDIQLTVAHDCLDALNKLETMKTGRLFKKRHFPDITVMDAWLPVLDGFQCTERFSEMGAKNICIMTAHLDPDLVPRAVSAGADTVFKKSLGLTSIARAVVAMAEAIEAEKKEALSSKK
ncbi:MAG: response regulator [Candidatus Thorarchaeota archaeon]